MFLTYSIALGALRHLRRLLGRIARRDASLAGQLRRAAAGMLLNLAESRGRFGGDRTHLLRCAFGSARESRAALEAAVALGYLEPAEIVEADAALDQVCAMLWRSVR